MELIIVSISPKCIAVYYPFHECGISLKYKSENMQEIDSNQNEIILFPPQLFVYKCRAERNYISLCKFFIVWNSSAQENEKLSSY